MHFCLTLSLPANVQKSKTQALDGFPFFERSTRFLRSLPANFEKIKAQADGGLSIYCTFDTPAANFQKSKPSTLGGPCFLNVRVALPPRTFNPPPRERSNNQAPSLWRTIIFLTFEPFSPGNAPNTQPAFFERLTCLPLSVNAQRSTNPIQAFDGP